MPGEVRGPRGGGGETAPPDRGQDASKFAHICRSDVAIVPLPISLPHRKKYLRTQSEAKNGGSFSGETENRP